MAATSEVRFSVWERNGHPIVDIGDELGGYRLLGPKFAGEARFVGQGRSLSMQDVTEIRRYLDKAETAIAEAAVYRHIEKKGQSNASK